MEKKLDVEDLAPGMYVIRLDRPWLESPFPFQGLMLENWADVREVRALCKQVYIETAPPREGSGGKPATNRHQPSDDARWQGRLRKLADKPPVQPAPPVALRREAGPARLLHGQTTSFMRSALHRARRGDDIDVPAARAAVRELSRSVFRNPDALLWLGKLKQKHEYTYQHSLSVCILSLVFGRFLGLTEEQMQALGLGAFLHDIGKMQIDQALLDKTTPLTAEETAVMRRHTEYGVAIVDATGDLSDISRDIILSHHERMDGSGYPAGADATDIMPLTHMVAICDTYDAIVSARPYKEPVSALAAIAILTRARGTLFDPWLVDRFVQCIGVYPVGTVVELNNGETAIVVAINPQTRLHPRVLVIRNREGAELAQPFIRDLARSATGSESGEYNIVHALTALDHGSTAEQFEHFMASS